MIIVKALLLVFGTIFLIAGYLPVLFNEKEMRDAEASKAKALLAVIVSFIPAPTAIERNRAGMMLLGVGVVLLAIGWLIPR